MLKIVTFNIRCDYGQDGKNNFVYRKALIERRIRQERPDIICFQEVLPHVAEWIKNTFSEYNTVGCGREEELDGEQMTVSFRKDRLSMAAMETYWLSPDPYRPGSRYEEQSECPRICTELVLQDIKEKKVFRLINTHLDHIGEKPRKCGLQQILKKLQTTQFLPDIPVILAGDFNAEPDSEAIKLLDGSGWKNLTQGIGITFHGFLPEEKQMVIDYIYLFEKQQLFYPVNVQKWEDKENGVWISDHFPVCVWLEYR